MMEETVNVIANWKGYNNENAVKNRDKYVRFVFAWRDLSIGI